MPIIEIGKTKQLFFDDYLIESLTKVKQGLNPAVKAEVNPVLRPERPWEGRSMAPSQVVFDEDEQVFKMWYRTGTSKIRVDEDGKPIRGGAARDCPPRRSSPTTTPSARCSTYRSWSTARATWICP